MSDSSGTLRCKRCNRDIAVAVDAIEIGGAHEHQVTNPEERRFRIACFSRAGGARPIKIPSGHWTWFPGYMWQRAWCRGCDSDVGWYFSRRDHSFYALDLDRLTDQRSTSTITGA